MISRALHFKTLWYPWCVCSTIMCRLWKSEEQKTDKKKAKVLGWVFLSSLTNKEMPSAYKLYTDRTLVPTEDYVVSTCRNTYAFSGCIDVAQEQMEFLRSRDYSSLIPFIYSVSKCIANWGISIAIIIYGNFYNCHEFS